MVLVDDARMAALNRQYRGIAGTTDVLAFPMLEPAPGDAAPCSGADQIAGADAMFSERGAYPEEQELLLGDIVISVPKALSQAADYGNTLQEELVLLAVHGMLHLLGYDDLDESGAARMEERARQVIAKLELGVDADV